MNDKVRQGERIAKVIARAGLCSRRDAEKWIAAGRVRVNGATIDSPALNVSDTDRIAVDDKIIGAQKSEPKLFRYYKPVGLVTSHRDEKGRATVFDNLPDDLPRLISIGRLDLNSEGLLLLTNDGELSRMLELPSTGWIRRYRVRAFGSVTQERLDTLKKGCIIDGVKYGSVTATLDQTQGGNCWITVSLAEGKNREIRKVLAHLGLQVNRLIRLSYGPFQLGKLARGAVEPVPLKTLKEQLPAFFRS